MTLSDYIAIKGKAPKGTKVVIGDSEYDYQKGFIGYYVAIHKFMSIHFVHNGKRRLWTTDDAGNPLKRTEYFLSKPIE